METHIQDSSIHSILSKMRIGSLIIAASLALQVTAAGEKNSTSSSEDVLSDQTMQPDNPVNGDVSKNQGETIEEITIMGQQIIFNLRERIIQAEDSAFEIFNALNDDDMYDVQCRMVANTGTLIKKRVCLPNFYHTATADEASEHLGLIGEYSTYSAPSPSARNVFAYRFPIFKAKVKQVAKENPELLYALKDLFELTEELKKKRNAYHGVDVK